MNNQLLTLDDAVRVATRNWGVDPDIARQEFEQKVWIQQLDDTVLMELMNVIMSIHPQNIANVIANDELREWCEQTQVDLQMLIIKRGTE